MDKIDARETWRPGAPDATRIQSSFKQRRNASECIHSAFGYISLSFVFQCYNALLYLGGGRGEDLDASNPIRLLLFLAIYTTATLFCLRKIPYTAGTFYENPILLTIAIYPLLTLLWSVDPGITFRRSLAHTLTIILCVYYFIYLTPENFLRMSSRILLVAGIFSIFYTLFFPSVAVHNCCGLEGSFKGIFGHKNDLGRISVIAIICAIYAPPSIKYPHWSCSLTLGVYLILLLGSQSTTNILTSLLVIGFAVFLKFIASSKLSETLRVMSTILVASIIIFAVTLGLGTVLELFGKDTTFSGRTTLWSALSEILRQKYTYLGAGYGAFFTNQGAGLDLTTYIAYWYKIPTHAHNGYWDARVNIGIPGLVILFIALAIYLIRALKCLNNRRISIGAPAICYFLLFSINNYTESETFQNGDYPWVIFITILLYLGKRSTLSYGAFKT
ncbi:MAG: O-antigen ligase family protein [Pseudoruegeria sp.]